MIPTIKFIAFSILMGVLFSACMHSTVLNVVRPADIDIPSEIVTFSVVQRHEAPKGKRFKKNWEGMVSGERIGLDQRSANFSSTGLILELSKSPRFSIKQVIMNEKFYGTGTMTMAEPLSWEEVEKDVWTKTDDYFFKRSHAIGYATAICVQLNLMVEKLG